MPLILASTLSLEINQKSIAFMFNNLSPLSQRRIQNFFANRFAKWSLFLFSLLFIVSMCAELVANSRPLLVKFDGELYTPVFKTYPETLFGGDFDTEADYTDDYVTDLIEEKGWLIWPPIRYSFDTIVTGLDQAVPSPPTWKNVLGTDDQSRDVAARVIYGFRTSVLFAVFLTLGSSIIGIIVGAVQGYYGGKVDLIGQRILEIWGGLPELYMLIILASLVTPSFIWLLAIMLLFSWPRLVDLVRAEFLRGRNFEYVRAAKALGVSDRVIMYRHVLPNAMVATMTFMPFIFTGAITTLTALDFLGFGLPPGSASLGELVLQGKNNLHAPWLALSGFCVISLMLTLVVFIGEGVRDAFDPRLNIA